MGVGDYDVVMITPPIKYRAERESEMKTKPRKKRASSEWEE